MITCETERMEDAVDTEFAVSTTSTVEDPCTFVLCVCTDDIMSRLAGL